MTTPLRQARRVSREPAPGSASRRTPSQTGIPRPRAGSHSATNIPVMASRAAANRQANTQPTYDFLAGGGAPDADQQLRQSRIAFQKSAMSVKADMGNEELRAQLKTLQYELDSYKQEKEVTRLRHEKELRDAQTSAEADAKKAQMAEKTGTAATSKNDALVRELRELQDASSNTQRELERKLRSAQEEARMSKEELEDVHSESARLDREQKNRLEDLEKRHASLQAIENETQKLFAAESANLERAREKLAEKEAEIGNLESSVLELKALSGSADELRTIKNQLTEQVSHMRTLEKTNQDQLVELRRLRESHRAVGIVEEEKRVLQRKVQRMEELERELGEANFRRQVLEEERKSWNTHLQGHSSENGAPEFDSPEAMNRALEEERMQRVTLSEQLGSVQPLLAEKEQMINGLDNDIKRLKNELEQAKSGAFSEPSGAGIRSKSRIERQKNLLTKEVEYLRAQLRTFDSEDTTQELDRQATLDEQTRKRIIDLEDMVAKYQSELEATNTELSSQNNAQALRPDAKPTKRRLADDDEENEQLGTLSRKNRKLQEELTAGNQRNAMLDRELEASRAQLASLQELSRNRILSLRNNPTDNFERVKLSQIRTLRTENEGLHALLERKQITDVVPRTSLAAKEQEIEEWKIKVAEREKRMLRLKQSWAAKALELRQAVASILGWKVEFAPNGKFKLSSIFYPQGDEDDDESEGGLGSNYLIFDGEQGTVQVSGGPESEFARDIKGLVKFWVEGRKEIPGLMAACTLEFYEKTTRAMRM